MNFTVLYKQEDEGWYTATVPSLPWCISYWESIEHASEMIREAIDLYLEESELRWDKCKMLDVFVWNLVVS